LNINASSPSPDASYLALTPKISGADAIIEAPYGSSSGLGVLECGSGTSCASGVISVPASGVASFNTRTGAVTLSAADVNAVGAITNTTSGTSANITATSNSTLTSLPSLALPYSQLTGTPTIPTTVTINSTSCTLGAACYPPVNAFTPITSASVNLGSGPYANYKTGVVYNAQSTAAAAFGATLPAPTQGAYWCVKNWYNGSAANTGVITVTVANTGTQSIIYNGAVQAGGTISSAGAAGDYACFTGVSATLWDFNPSVGAW
jgi:hypothetical protein